MSKNIDQASMLRVGTILHGIYRIDRYLSSGGFGNTYVATHIEFDEVYAIKEFFINGVTERDANNTTVSVSNSANKDLFHSQLNKFKKEARRIRNLNNNHIVRVHNLFEENGTAYYVMDYIDGESLSERMDRLQRPLKESEVLQLYPQILDALHTVHQQGIFHLDLKPGNIMVDDQWNAKLIDFGASKQQSSAEGGRDMTSTLMCYTNGYAPREQMERNFEKIGPWTDIYALGATLYALLTRHRPPLPSDIDDDRSLDKHLALPLPADVSAGTRVLILRLLKTDRVERPQSIEKLLAEDVHVDDVNDNDDKEEETLLIPEALKDFDGWKQKVAGTDYYKGYYTALEVSLDKLMKVKTNAALLTTQQEAKAAYANLQESVVLYKKFFSLETIRDYDGVIYNWSLVDDKLKQHDTSMKNEELKALLAKFEASGRAVVPPEVVPTKGFFEKHGKTILWSSFAAIVAFFVLLSLWESPSTIPDVSEPDKIVVRDISYNIPTMGDGVYSGAIDENGLPNDIMGIFRSENYDFEYKGTFVHGVAEGNAEYNHQGKSFTGTFKNNEYEDGTLTDKDGSFYVGTFYDNQPCNGEWYTKSGKLKKKVIDGKELN